MLYSISYFSWYKTAEIIFGPQSKVSIGQLQISNNHLQKLHTSSDQTLAKVILAYFVLANQQEYLKKLYSLLISSMILWSYIWYSSRQNSYRSCSSWISFAILESLVFYHSLAASKGFQTFIACLLVVEIVLVKAIAVFFNSCIDSILFGSVSSAQ